MTLNRQFSLLPERGDELRSALHRLESVACEGAYFANSVQTQVGQLALLHVAPDVLGRVEFGRVSGQSLQDEVPVERFNVVLDEAAAVRRQAIPDDEQLAAFACSALAGIRRTAGRGWRQHAAGNRSSSS